MKMGNGSLPELPPELYEHIIAFLDDRRDLLRICLTNSILHDLAARYLYRRLRIQDFRRAVAACILLVKRPHIAAYVTQLEADFGEVPDWIVHQWPKPRIFLNTFAPAYCRIMFRAFGSMNQLEHLTFKNTSPLGRLPMTNLANCTFRVRSLTLPTSTFEHVILQSQPLIEDLEVLDGPSFSILALRRTAIPHLKRLAAFQIDAKYLIPGRPVVEFRRLDTLLEEHVPDCLNTLSQSTGPLKRVRLLMMKIDGLFFVRAAAAIPDIVDLVIHGMGNVEHTVSEELQTFEVVHAFRGFRSLKNIEIHSYYDGSAEYYFPPIHVLGRACSTLETFTIVDELRGNSDRSRLPAYQLHRELGKILQEGELEWIPRNGIVRTPPSVPGRQVTLVEWIG
ncbi:hypothetical protein DACRYDRAFT_110870 [Dacryopinax primogenitus]|uniref:F-box domain-containing protein n=1 Tax=Dacryopinax primogenitus (strain DJM 731) TaxID=1858805 RepID=M5FPC1_DACPD|nr:uncharacterized protein DACRYDRAFT_110870 [Dacryopinax primogenitus]EJT98425.1 hypothetical protein DACRYDRAFT_110870 [Dacryopinax primogenitus]